MANFQLESLQINSALQGHMRSFPELVVINSPFHNVRTNECSEAVLMWKQENQARLGSEKCCRAAWATHTQTHLQLGPESCHTMNLGTCPSWSVAVGMISQCLFYSPFTFSFYILGSNYTCKLRGRDGGVELKWAEISRFCLTGLSSIMSSALRGIYLLRDV